jgi:hypothetical protein
MINSKTEATVIVRPVVRKKPWVNTKDFDKNKLHNASTVLVPDLDSYGLHTGLDEEGENKFEKSLGFPKGHLSSVVTNDYWTNFTIKLKDEPNVFHKGTPREALIIEVLKSHSKVANSLEEVTPDTDFYIEDIEAEQEKNIKSVEVKEEAFLKFSKLSSQGKKDILKIYGEGGDTVSDATIKNMLASKLEDDPSRFLKVANLSKEIVKTRSFIFDLEDYGVIRKRADVYFDGDNSLGDMRTFSEFLLMPDKQSSYIMYKDRLEHAKLSS